MWYHQSACWYPVDLVMAMSLDSSSESMASFRNFSAAPVDTLGPYPYHDLVGNTASALYTMKNGVKLVDLLGIVRKFQSTEGTSATHFPAQVLSQAWTSSPS
jgi:hypothetical protein